jgi:hypothetical protein
LPNTFALHDPCFDHFEGSELLEFVCLEGHHKSYRGCLWGEWPGPPC